MSKMGVICNIEGDCYFVLTDSGDFIQKNGRPPAGKRVGDRVELSQAKKVWLPGLAIVAAIAMVFISTLSFWPGSESGYLLALDINPSIGLEYDDEYNLLTWHAYNSAGEDLLAVMEQPGDLYTALATLFKQSVELDLVEDEQQVFLSVLKGTSLDEAALADAFSGRGAKVQLVVVELDKEDFKDKKTSPLRSHLSVLSGQELKSEPVASVAQEYLSNDLVKTIEVAPWHNNPIVQHFVEEYLVSGKLVEQMLEEGLSQEEIAGLMDLANSQRLTPGDIFKQLRESGTPPGQFLKDNRGEDMPNNSPVPASWVAELLAMEFGYSPGQLTSLMRRGIAQDSLVELLVLAELSSNNLSGLANSYEPGNDLASELGVDEDKFVERVDFYTELLEGAQVNVGPKAQDLAREFKLSQGEVLGLMARGLSSPEVRLVLSNTSKRNLGQVLEELDGGKSLEDILGQKDSEIEPGKPPGNPGQGQGNGQNSGKGNPGKGSGQGPGNAPGQNKSNGN